MLLILWIKLSSMKKRYNRMLGSSGGNNIEELLVEIQEKLQLQEMQSVELFGQIEAISNRIKKTKSKLGVHRYDAFGDGRSNLSFSIAILDEYQTGIVLTGIHGRDQTYMYAKKLENGQPEYTLSPEEKEAVNQISMLP
ncbi:DUF4446 family protein [Paenibacillus eucommiae]|nr:DUF4446 family protein [Paenibacillus eucommiae]